MTRSCFPLGTGFVAGTVCFFLNMLLEVEFWFLLKNWCISIFTITRGKPFDFRILWANSWLTAAVKDKIWIILIQSYCSTMPSCRVKLVAECALCRAPVWASMYPGGGNSFLFSPRIIRYSICYFTLEWTHNCCVLREKKNHINSISLTWSWGD